MKNRTILITGGGSGIGKALTLQLAEENKILICGRKEERLKKIADDHPNVFYYVADISKPENIDELFAKISADNHKPDVVFNNAGIVEQWDIRNTHLDSTIIFEKINTNLSGAVAVTQNFINQADPTKENLIINVSSTVALFPIPILPLYSTSKAGLHVFTQALRTQLKKSGFRVIEILPPAVDTAMPKQLGNSGKLLNVDEFARNIIAELNRGKNEITSGSDAILFKLFSRLLPKSGLRIVDKMSRKQLQVK